jgi:hypothetical protein
MRGQVTEKVFVPYREQDGTIPILSEELQRKNNSDRIQKAEDKVTALAEVAEAVRLIRSGGFRWRLKEYESGQANIFRPKRIEL